MPIGLAPRAQWEVSIAASELATNVLKFAGGGFLALRHVRQPLIRVAAIGRGHDGVAVSGMLGALQRETTQGRVMPPLGAGVSSRRRARGPPRRSRVR